MTTLRPRAPTTATALRKLIATAAAEYTSRRKRAEATVVRWAWATGPLYSLAPLWAARLRGPVIRALKSAPAKKRDLHEFGFDDQDRLTVVRQHTAQRGAAYETFIDWDDAGATAIRYDYDPAHKVVANAARLFVEDGRPVGYLLQSHRGTVRETYRYARGRLVSIRVEPPGEVVRLHRVRYDGKDVARLDPR